MKQKLIRQIISMEYCHSVSGGALHYYFDMLEKIKNQVHSATGLTFPFFPAPQKIIVIWSVLNSSIGSIIEDAHPSQLTDIKGMSLLLYLIPCGVKLWEFVRPVNYFPLNLSRSRVNWLCVYMPLF